MVQGIDRAFEDDQAVINLGGVARSVPVVMRAAVAL
jgi:hypothetical protein